MSNSQVCSVKIKDIRCQYFPTNCFILTKMSPSKHESRKRGPTPQALANMKNEAKNKYEFTPLIHNLYKLKIKLFDKDKQLAIDNIL